MKYFFDEEAEIIDTIIDELEMHPGTKKGDGFKQQYVFSSGEGTRKKIRAILNRVYEQGAEK